MKAMILAAGLGTRLKPWTLSHPKALVPVKGIPMLERVIYRLKEEGFDEIIVNVHHFGEQIIDFLNNRDFGVRCLVSDERDTLLDTGGGIVKADVLIGPEPLLVHNADILSNASLAELMAAHIENGDDSTLLVSDRDSSRKLIFDSHMSLLGWHHIVENRYRPAPLGAVTAPYIESDPSHLVSEAFREYAFSGIYVAGPEMRREMRNLFGVQRFPVMDYLLSEERRCKVSGLIQPDLQLIDIGKPDTLLHAEDQILLD